MIIYFANRQLDIIGQASTELPKGLTIVDDLKTDDIETGVSIFEFKIPFDEDNRLQVESFASVGNYVLRSEDDESNLYQIVELEVDTKKQQIYAYAEDDGMDLLNEVVGEYAAAEAYPITHYINKYASSAGFVIGRNEASDLTRKLSWDGESTAAARIASVATQFGGCEISYSFKVDGLDVVKKYINIYKERGQDISIPLRLNQDIDSIITTKSIENLATAFQCTGATPEDKEDPITLKGYTYDDGNFYVDSNGILKSRKALEKWQRLLWKDGEKQREGGHITKQYDYDTESQKTLCAHAITELKKVCDMEINFDIEIKKLPDNVRVGDRVNIVDDAGELYLNTRILTLETSICDQTNQAILGEHKLQKSGISAKVQKLAEKFSKTSVSAARALAIANAAKTAAAAAQTQADSALIGAENAQTAADNAQKAADAATESAAAAQKAADDAQAAVDNVENSVESLEQTIDDAQAAADNAQLAAETADAKAQEAADAAAAARAEAADAAAAVIIAQENAETAIEKAEEAQNTADTAKSDAATAKETADAAKLDAEKAEEDIASLGEQLTTVKTTMEADYARKTDLTETEANLQSQISQNAAQIATTVAKVETIDETANNAAEQAAQAQAEAEAAKAQADQAAADAALAQDAADDAALAAANARAEADNAKLAADTAQAAADKADADLTAAKEDLATVQGRVDATEEEIAAAEAAVEAAQATADKAKTDADAAAVAAAAAQTKADQAVTDAEEAKTTADDAAAKAELAQQVANEAKGDASNALARAEQAATDAAAAQETANTAVTNANNAQAQADAAAAAAAEAQQAADTAQAAADKADADLTAAKQNLANVTSRVDATEAEIEAAQAAVETAQAAADKAKTDADAAQATADQAKADAETAQAAADNAQLAADAAQTAADEAQKAADEAQAAVDALAVRVSKAETDIVQTSEKIALLATKKEVTQTLGGYYTKEETDAVIQIESDEINSTVKKKFAGLQIGGRNLLLNSNTFSGDNISVNSDAVIEGTYEKLNIYSYDFSAATSGTADILQFKEIYPEKLGAEYTLSFYAKGSGKMTTYFYGATGYLQCADVTRSTGEITHAGDGNSGWELTEEWVRYWVTWKLADEGDITVQKYVLFRLHAGAQVSLCGIKLEKGNKATDWTPAPEDIDEATKNAQSTADEAASSANDNANRLSAAESVVQQLVDSISSLIRDGDGGSLIKQDTDGVYYFNIGDLQQNISDTANALDDLEGIVLDANGQIDVLKSTAAALQERTEYVKSYTDDNGQPCLELGEGDTSFKVLITNDKIEFKDGTATPAYLSNQKLYIEKAEVTDELQFGGFVWTARSNGNVGLIWKGVD